jgi:hypothetical protein
MLRVQIQAKDSNYSQVLSQLHGTMSLCEYLFVVNQMFCVDVPADSRLSRLEK